MKEEVVEFNIDGSFAIGGREDLALSRQLRDIFNLEGAQAIKPDSPPSRYKSPAADDFIHLALANIAGISLKDRLEPNDKVALGPGRQFISALEC
ncbi:MAG: hypothetical protein IPG76_00290 [Acidobacteria bacterium]|nr:hypothetical protein [Acidobacteriota bacterium]